LITHPKFKVSIVNSTYYLVELSPNIDFMIEDLKQLVKAEQELGGKKLPVLVMCTATSNTNIHLLRYLKENKNNPYSSADAFVIASNTQIVLGNFYLKINQPERPTKFFNREADALEWLKSFFNK
jgi:hypothetical protein